MSLAVRHAGLSDDHVYGLAESWPRGCTWESVEMFWWVYLATVKRIVRHGRLRTVGSSFVTNAVL